MSYTLVLEWMPGDLYMSAVTARCTAPTSSYSVVWLPPNKVYQITLYCGSTSLVSFLVGAFRGKAWSYMNFYSVRDLRTTQKAIWEKLEQDGEVVITNNGKPSALLFDIGDGDLEETLKAVRQAKAMMAFNSMRGKAAEKGYMSDEEIEAEIAAARQEE